MGDIIKVMANTQKCKKSNRSKNIPKKVQKPFWKAELSILVNFHLALSTQDILKSFANSFQNRPDIVHTKFQWALSKLLLTLIWHCPQEIFWWAHQTHFRAQQTPFKTDLTLSTRDILMSSANSILIPYFNGIIWKKHRPEESVGRSLRQALAHKKYVHGTYVPLYTDCKSQLYEEEA